MEKGRRNPSPSQNLLTDAQLGDECTIAVDVLLCQVVQQVTALTNHHQQTAAGVVVMLVNPQVVGQLVDPGGQDSYLNLGSSVIPCLLMN